MKDGIEQKIKKYHRYGERYKKRWNNTVQRLDRNANKRMGLAGVFLLSGTLQAFFPQQRGLTLVFVLSIIGFLILLRTHERLKKFEGIYRIYHDLYEKDKKRLEGKWREFPEKGEEFIDEDHRYSRDLDIFGQGSVFQWLNHTVSLTGKRQLAEFFLHPLETKEAVELRQGSLKELGDKNTWARKYLAIGNLHKDFRRKGKNEESEKLVKWIKETKAGEHGTFYTLMRTLLPIGTLLSIIAGVLLKGPISFFLIVPFLQFLYFSKGFPGRGKVLGLVKEYQNSLKGFEKQLIAMEKMNFSSAELKKLHKNLHEGEIIPSNAFHDLEKIASRVMNRQNLFFLPINYLLLWDHHCLYQLDNWKRKTGEHIEEWLEQIGKMEALISLSMIYRDYDEWTVPEVLVEKKEVKAAKIGHPLITRGRVDNDVHLTRATPILLITGSNMSGKSTLLRTVGLNLLFMQMGLKVAATEFEAPIFNLYTCMRISDNLEKSISSFYGEILRVKTIIEATKKSEDVFFLLDEIFKGTNSKDRHLGAKILIHQLYNEGAMGLVSTHDLELVTLEDDSGAGVKNYHFQETYYNEEIHFDYRLKEGHATTSNALVLMKMAGVDLDKGKEFIEGGERC